MSHRSPGSVRWARSRSEPCREPCRTRAPGPPSTPRGMTHILQVDPASLAGLGHQHSTVASTARLRSLRRSKLRSEEDSEEERKSDIWRKGATPNILWMSDSQIRDESPFGQLMVFCTREMKKQPLLGMEWLGLLRSQNPGHWR